MNHYNSSGYTINRCTFDRQYFYYFNSFPVASSSVSSFQMGPFEFVYGWITFYNRYRFLFAAKLSIPALISGLHKISQVLDLPFTLDLGIGANPQANSDWGALFHQKIITVESLFYVVNIYGDIGLKI